MSKFDSLAEKYGLLAPESNIQKIENEKPIVSFNIDTILNEIDQIIIKISSIPRMEENIDLMWLNLKFQAYVYCRPSKTWGYITISDINRFKDSFEKLALRNIESIETVSDVENIKFLFLQINRNFESIQRHILSYKNLYRKLVKDMIFEFSQYKFRIRNHKVLIRSTIKNGIEYTREYIESDFANELEPAVNRIEFILVDSLNRLKQMTIPMSKIIEFERKFKQKLEEEREIKEQIEINNELNSLYETLLKITD